VHPNRKCIFILFLADPDLESGLEKNPDPGSESGMNIPDYFSESLEILFLDKNMVFKFFDADPDPGWEKFGSETRGKIPDPQR
jgi:hypothetical protein